MQSEQEQKPPFFRSWNAVYALVIGSLLAVIVLLYLFTRYYQ